MRLPWIQLLCLHVLLLLGTLHQMPALAEVEVRRESYRGWTQAVLLANRRVEVVVVPEIGRIQQFRFSGTRDGVFWENPVLSGKPMISNAWERFPGSFGGDKTWPAPQSAWNWPPPDIFDAAPLSLEVNPDRSLQLTSPLSPRFGIRTVRRVVLEPEAPVFRVETTYFKQAGDPVDVSVWVITQLNPPEATYYPVPATTAFPTGLAAQWKPSSGHVTLRDGLVRFTRDPKASQKIGNDADRMAWVGRDAVVRIDLPRLPGATYPDEGCSVEIYTNPDPTAYVELETLGPRRRLNVGERLSATNYYRLERRSLTEPDAEARRILALPNLTAP